MNDNKTDIYEYIDYRSFLKDWLEEQKLKRQNYSLSMFARKLQQSSMALNYVINQQRHISDERINCYAKALELNHSESLYFEEMVLFNKAKDIQEKSGHYEELLNCKA